MVKLMAEARRDEEKLMMAMVAHGLLEEEGSSKTAMAETAARTAETST